ncbi:MAG TPA: hypothetical protein VIY72_11960 [Acidimicrobiales bacterium]
MGVPIETFELSALSSTVRLIIGPSRPPAVEVDYQGTEPPVGLFSHLAVVGFGGLVPQPPPAAAIQWTSADGAPLAAPVILPFRASTQGTLEGRPEDRGRAVDAARFILEQLSRTGVTGHVAAHSTSRPATAPVGGPDRTAQTPGSASGGQFELEIVADRGAAEDVRFLLGSHARVTQELPTTWTSTIRYRGSESEEHHRAVRFRVAVTPGNAEALVAGLARQGVRSVTRVA